MAGNNFNDAVEAVNGLTEAQVKALIEACIAGLTVDSGETPLTQAQLIGLLDGYVPDHMHDEYVTDAELKSVLVACLASGEVPLPQAQLKSAIVACLEGPDSPVTEAYILNLIGDLPTGDGGITSLQAKALIQSCIDGTNGNTSPITTELIEGVIDVLSEEQVKQIVFDCVLGQNGFNSPVTAGLIQNLVSIPSDSDIKTIAQQCIDANQTEPPTFDRYVETMWIAEDKLTGVGGVVVTADQLDECGIQSKPVHFPGEVVCFSVDTRLCDNSIPPLPVANIPHDGGVFKLWRNSGGQKTQVVSVTLTPNSGVALATGFAVPFVAGDYFTITLEGTGTTGITDPRVTAGYTQTF